MAIDYSLASRTLRINGTNIDQGTYSFNPNVTGDPIFQYSNESQGFPIPSQVGKETIIRSITVTVTQGTDVYNSFMHYYYTRILQETESPDVSLYFDDTNIIYRSNKARIEPPDNIDHVKYAESTDWIVTFIETSTDDKGVGKPL